MPNFTKQIEPKNPSFDENIDEISAIAENTSLDKKLDKRYDDSLKISEYSSSIPKLKEYQDAIDESVKKRKELEIAENEIPKDEAKIKALKDAEMEALKRQNELYKEVSPTIKAVSKLNRS